jgi:hypothetical protein
VKAIASDSPDDFRAAKDALAAASSPDDKAYQAYVSAKLGDSSVTDGMDQADPDVIAASAMEAEMQRQPNAESLFRKASAHNAGKFLPVLAYMSYLKRHSKAYDAELSVAQHGLAKTPEEQQSLSAFK